MLAWRAMLPRGLRRIMPEVRRTRRDIRRGACLSHWSSRTKILLHDSSAISSLAQDTRSRSVISVRVASAFAGLALLLSAIGVYGLTAGEVATRWREIAIRLALGATRREATWTTMRPGASALLIGAVIGIAAALAAGRSMTALLYGVEPTDPPTLVAVPVLLAIVGLAAASFAAARVFRADPAATLRGE